eukprot:SAG22_NODE_12421_length_443_cov_1.168605_1_plen_24_part_10
MKPLHGLWEAYLELLMTTFAERHV